MDSARWRRIEALYHQALGLPADRRSAFLADACRGDDSVLALVTSMLQQPDAVSFMERPAMEVAAAQLADSTHGVPPQERRLGAYRLLRLIGAGGMGEVYQARDTRLGRDVAIKLLPPSLVANRDRLERFEREARLLAALNHPHIAAIYSIEEADGLTGLVLELVEGETLAQRIAKGPIPAAEALPIARQIADALQAAHAKGIIHRDLKPANVKVTAGGDVKVLDFGLAKVWSHEAGAIDISRAHTLTASDPTDGTLLGTPGYMSPEQARGKPLDTRADVWAFGCVLFEMIAGVAAFDGDSAVETISRVLEREPDYGLLPRATPRAIRVLLRTCLEKDVERRASDIGKVRQTIERCIDRRRSRLGQVVRFGAAAAALAAALVAGATVAPRWLASVRRAGAPTAFADRDWLLIADLDNQTGKQLFDKSVNTALSVSIGQSSYVNLLPASRVQEALRRMKRPADAPVDVGTAREIAVREDVRLVLAPALSGIGGNYLLSARLVDPAKGNEVAAFSVRIDREPNVLPAIDDLTRQVRQRLGEATAAVERQSKPLQKVTTSSLEALRLYSAARDKFIRESTPTEARALYENALRIDPSFTAAKAQLGMLHWELFDRATGTALLEDAANHADSLADPEKYGVLAFHAAAIENNPAKAADYWKALLALYPDRSEAHNNLARAYHQMDHLDEAVREYKDSIALNPSVLPPYYSLATIYLYDLGRPADAAALSRQALARNDRLFWLQNNLGFALLGTGDLDGARRAFEKSIELDPRFTIARLRLGYTLRLQGKLPEARRTFQQIQELNPGEADPFYSAGVVSALMDDAAAARVSFEQFRRRIEQALKQTPTDARLRWDYALGLARLGLTDRAIAEAEKADVIPRMARSMDRSVFSGFPALALSEPRVTNGPDAAFDRARLLSVIGKRSDAIRALEEAVGRGYRNYVSFKVHDDLAQLASEPAFEQLCKKVLGEQK